LGLLFEFFCTGNEFLYNLQGVLLNEPECRKKAKPKIAVFCWSVSIQLLSMLQFYWIIFDALYLILISFIDDKPGNSSIVGAKKGQAKNSPASTCLVKTY
jgi:hypothetical protein